MIKKTLIITTIALASTFTLSGCSTNGTDAAKEKAPVSDILTRELPNDVTPEGVLSAAVILSTGNIDEALSEGIVTPAEVAEAQKAIDDGTLGLWRERAEN